MGVRPNQSEMADRIDRGTGRPIRVAVIDSGVDFDHRRLSGLRRADDHAVVERSGRLEMLPNDRGDCYGHGTAVAGIIHAIAPEAEIGSFRVLGDGLDATSRAVRLAATHAIESGYQILNVSMGCSRREMVLVYKEWVDLAWLRGVHVVAAANNRNFRRVEWPGHFTSVLTASCNSHEGDHGLRHRAGTLAEFAIGGVSERVAWKNGEVRVQTGSSYSAARLTGLLAGMLGEEPALDVLGAKLALRKLARRDCESSRPISS